MRLSSRMATLAFLGDVMLGRGVCDQMQWRRPEDFWGSTLSVLRAADAVIANLECAVTRCRTRWSKTPKIFHFRSDVAAIDVLRAGNVRCVTLANNHVLDYGEEGLLETLRYLDLAGIARAGAGRMRQEAAAPALFEVADLRVAVVSITDNEPAFAATEHLPGTNYARLDGMPAPLARIAAAMEDARGNGADVIILSPHWGANMTIAPTPEFRALAHAAIERGIDVIHGHSAHVFHGVEVRNHRPIMYDAGDFLDDYSIDHELHNNWSFIFLLDIVERRPVRVRMLPVHLTYARVDLAEGKLFDAICQTMVERSEAFGTVLSRIDRGLEVSLEKPAAASQCASAARPYNGG